MTSKKTEPVRIDSGNFHQEVLECKLPVLLDFWAEWCMPCKMMDSTIEELAEEYAGRLKVGKVNTDDTRDVSMKYGVTAIPTLTVFWKGQVVKKFIGLQRKADLKVAIDELIGG